VDKDEGEGPGRVRVGNNAQANEEDQIGDDQVGEDQDG
jgi:hypothetical protein